MKIKHLFGFLALVVCLQLKAQSSACLSADSIRIVVIGSSTAAGTGASPSDSSWVNRYRHFLQSLHPGNEVINLAQGGYNTWRLMPDNFIPPSNRPTPDTFKNISHALRQNPDGIIINLPSNDAAIGTGLNEQMHNFILMDSLAASAGVPVWVCTTQPRNFSASAIQVQLDVRDSIFSYFGKRALDFWNGLANNQNTIDSLYDSGDGVHVNNAGHRLLWQRAVQKAIPDSLIQGLAGLDLQAIKPVWLNPSSCGGGQSLFELRIGNLGEDSINSPALIELIREDLNSGQVDTISQSISSLKGCAFVSSTFSLNTKPALRWRIKSRVNYPGDLDSSNNESAWLQISSSEAPSGFALDTVLCEDDSLSLGFPNSDVLRWYADSDLQQVIHQGDSLQWSGHNPDTLFTRAYRGPFYFKDSLRTSSSSNISWNGIMFNLIAGADTVYLDSLDFVSGNSANMEINLRTRPGSYQGYESSATGWSSSLKDSIHNALDGESATAHFGTIVIPANDTLGCYLYFSNSNHRLFYQGASSPLISSGGGLSAETGTGVAHTFGTTYYPRHFRGQFHYHYGYKADGQCQSELDTIIIRKSTAELDLGTDTIILNGAGDFSILDLPVGFSNPFWSDSSSANSITVTHPGAGATYTHWFWLEALDSLGCLHRDSVYFDYFFFSLDENESRKYHIFPNPSSQGFTIRSDNADQYELRLLSLDGSLLRKTNFKDLQYHWDPKLKPGVYILQISSSNGIENLKIQIQ